jgi:sulfoxide reductase catalytic subunit YedY
MLIRTRRGWEIPERLATPQSVVMGRRAAVAGAAAGVAALGLARPALALAPDPRFPPERPITPEKIVSTYNNYYEFGDDKNIWPLAQKLPQSPWSIEISGMVEKKQTIALEDLLRRVNLEERVYRHRCVEAWSIVVPWTGFQLSELVKIAAPTASAKYVVFQTLMAPKYMPGLQQPFYPWPYTEGLTMPEAMNELAFIVTGMYGKALLPQDGGPIRLVVPWKYGFKSCKAIVKVMFTDQRPKTFWEEIQPNEYGFWANVNPAVPHPRWSQASEKVLGTNDRVPTQIYNGYGSFVAGLYTGMTNERLYM